jgi:hypothetical protein
MKALFKVRRLWTLMVKKKLKVHVSNKLLKRLARMPHYRRFLTTLEPRITEMAQNSS